MRENFAAAYFFAPTSLLASPKLKDFTNAARSTCCGQTHPESILLIQVLVVHVLCQRTKHWLALVFARRAAPLQNAHCTAHRPFVGDPFSYEELEAISSPRFAKQSTITFCLQGGGGGTVRKNARRRRRTQKVGLCLCPCLLCSARTTQSCLAAPVRDC